MVNALTDEVLLERIVADDHGAFSILVHRYNRQLYRIIKPRVKFEDDAKDIIQEIFISFWNRRHNLQLNGDILPYLSQAVRYAVIDWHIKNQKYLTKIELLLPESEVPAVDKQIIAEELTSEILELTNKLPSNVRMVFKLSKIDHKTNGEIAQELNLSDKTVRNSLSIAINYLRDHMGTTLTLASFCAILEQLLAK